MPTFGSQFNGMTQPRPKGGFQGTPRRPDSVSHHPEHGKVGSLSAVARELGMQPAALNMQRRRRHDFPAPILGSVYAVDRVAEFRDGADDGDGGDGGGE